MITAKDLYIKLRQWKEIIVMDQYSAFYQNHMGPLAYLRLMMPFGGLQVLARSGQGLLGQSKELDKPMSKIL